MDGCAGWRGLPLQREPRGSRGFEEGHAGGREGLWTDVNTGGQGCIRREGGGGSGTQKFVYQKWCKSIFPVANSIAFGKAP